MIAQVIPKKNKQNQRQMKRWTSLENLHYFFFVALRLDVFQQHDKKRQIFKEMEMFILTKNRKECKGHNQKTLDAEPIVKLKQFYHQYYTQRLLDFDHCQKEFLHLLQQRPNYIELKGSTEVLLAKFRQNWKTVLNIDSVQAESPIKLKKRKKIKKRNKKSLSKNRLNNMKDQKNNRKQDEQNDQIDQYQEQDFEYGQYKPFNRDMVESEQIYPLEFPPIESPEQSSSSNSFLN